MISDSDIDICHTPIRKSHPHLGLTPVSCCRVKQNLEAGEHTTAMEITLKALQDHPCSDELQELLADVQAAVKWFPRFKDTLVKVYRDPITIKYWIS